jgi:hypothetical protein
MNYFKYMLLKLLAAPFNERRLESDFNNMADFLLETGQDISSIVISSQPM